MRFGEARRSPGFGVAVLCPVIPEPTEQGAYAEAGVTWILVSCRVDQLEELSRSDPRRRPSTAGVPGDPGQDRGHYPMARRRKVEFDVT